MGTGDQDVPIIVSVWRRDILNNPWLVIPHVSSAMIANMFEYLSSLGCFDNPGHPGLTLGPSEKVGGMLNHDNPLCMCY
jgi:hypothetical protein